MTRVIKPLENKKKNKPKSYVTEASALLTHSSIMIAGIAFAFTFYDKAKQYALDNNLQKFESGSILSLESNIWIYIIISTAYILLFFYVCITFVSLSYLIPKEDDENLKFAIMIAKIATLATFLLFTAFMFLLLYAITPNHDSSEFYGYILRYLSIIKLYLSDAGY